MRRFLLLGMVGLVGGGAMLADNNALEAIFDSTGTVWSIGADDFLARYREFGFRWETVNCQDTARSVRSALTFAGLPVLEALARFEQKNLRELSVSLYNRGDAGELDEVEFQKLIARIDKNLSAWAGTQGVLFKTQERTISAVLHRKSWVNEP